ncbi:MAG: RDD family protein [Gammaproteobacteria bacterium]|nr:RDD family protein [Gammaproteobacteria bacterium]
MTDYYIQRDGERLGPFDEATILRDRERGLLRDDDLLWAEGLEHWVPVSAAFAELKPEPRPAGAFDLEPLEEAPEPEARASERERGYRIAPEDPMYDIPHAGDFAYDYAGFWVRFGAVTIDNFIVWLLTVALSVGAMILWRMAMPEVDPEQPFAAMFPVMMPSLLSLVIPWLYFAGQEGGRHSATIGKRVFGLEVRFAHDLEPFGFMIATARFAVSIVSAVLLFIGYIMQPFTSRKQALHDLATGTVVIVRTQYSRLLLGIVIALPFLIFIALIMLGVFLGAVEQGWL